MLTRSQTSVVLLAMMLLIGAVAASRLLVLAGIAAVLGLSLLIILVLGKEKGLECCFFLVLFAETKFRNRSAGALLSGDVDAQIGFELALYTVVFILTAVNFATLPPERLRPKSNEQFVIYYALVAAASYFWSYNASITAVRALQQVTLVAFLYVAIRILTPARFLRALGLTLVFSVLTFALLAILVPAARGPWSIEMGHRVQRFSWFAVHPITAACEAGGALVFLLSERLYGKSKNLLKIPLSAFIVPIVAILFATRARGAILAAIAAVTLLIVRPRINSRLARFGAISVFGLIAVLAIAGFDPITSTVTMIASEDNPIGRYVLRGQSVDELLTVSGRTELWRGAYELFLNHPLLGHGYIASRSLLLAIESWAGEAHNALAESLLDLGIVGTVLLWLPLLRALGGSLKMVKIGRHTEWPYALVAAILTFVLFEGFVAAGFAGFLTYDPTLLFGSILAYDAIAAELTARNLQRQNYGGRQFAPREWRGGNGTAAAAAQGVTPIYPTIKRLNEGS